ncbi:MAG TPA: hypothetical protein VNO21_18840 [Polyangiaceae bacterium]|nr:hypothetical protein [Polyangiaceae bacterium]
MIGRPRSAGGNRVWKHGNGLARVIFDSRTAEEYVLIEYQVGSPVAVQVRFAESPLPYGARRGGDHPDRKDGAWDFGLINGAPKPSPSAQARQVDFAVSAARRFDSLESARTG